MPEAMAIEVELAATRAHRFLELEEGESGESGWTVIVEVFPTGSAGGAGGVAYAVSVANPSSDRNGAGENVGSRDQ